RRVRHHPRAARGARLYRCARLAPVRGIGGAASRTETDGVGRRITLSTLVVALVTVSAAGAANIQTSARYVRAAIPAVEAYAADHGSYKGATVAKLRRYDRSLGHIVIRSATKRTFCIESTTRPFAHKAGPGATVNTGRCGQKGTEIGYGSTPPASSPPTTAEQRIREAIPAMEAYAA